MIRRLVAVLTAVATILAVPMLGSSAVGSLPPTTAAYGYGAVATTSAPTLEGGAATVYRVDPQVERAADLAGDIARASIIFVAADTGFNAGLEATKLNMTRTVESHIGDYAKDGTLARPYADSRLTIQNVMDSVKPTADPGGVPGALRWDAPGSMNGSNGTWELVVDPSTNTVLHFMFRGAH